MKNILYEYPLNERLRNYLKIEQLFKQVNDCISTDLANNHYVYFTTLFAIFDSLERNDIRSEIIKDLEKLEQNLHIWSKNPDIDTKVLNKNLKLTVKLTCQLKSAQQAKDILKEDRFLNNLKQRFLLQGACCSFDLPHLKFWLHQPPEKIKTDCQHWLSLLQPINNAISLILTFIRQRCDFQDIETQKGFYQDSGEGLVLLRIKIPKDICYYPSVSGNKFRYSIRFIDPSCKSGNKQTNDAIAFKLSRC